MAMATINSPRDRPSERGRQMLGILIHPPSHTNIKATCESAEMRTENSKSRRKANGAFILYFGLVFDDPV